jgi:hypothetical protein
MEVAARSSPGPNLLKNPPIPLEPVEVITWRHPKIRKNLTDSIIAAQKKYL